jgi:hypothetical protein
MSVCDDRGEVYNIDLTAEPVSVLRSAFPIDILKRLRTAAEACFESIARGDADPGRYRFTPFSHSVLINALRDFGGGDPLAPIGASGISIPPAFECRLQESWSRKRFAPRHAPSRYQPNSWHQDGGLGVSYGAANNDVGPMTQLFTIWIPLQHCGVDSPGMEFVERKLDRLLHYSELGDAALRQRFHPEMFVAPHLRLGDGLLLLPGTLHRTQVDPAMKLDRLSVEYRFFPTQPSVAAG